MTTTPIDDSQRVVPVEPTLVEAITEKLTELLTGTYHCGRVWAAWGIGTMSADDFSPVEESDTPAEIAQAIVDMLTAAPAASPPVAPLAAAQDGVKPIPACWRYVHADPSNSSGWMDYDGDAELWELRGKKAQANGLTIELAYSRPPAQTTPASPADRMDGERLDWLMRQVRGDEFRRIGIDTSAGCTRAAIDAAREG